MKTQNTNTVELTNQEIKETEGGLFVGPVSLGVKLLAWILS
jgi:hypothetical protein